jgi:hypothetical protein
MPVQGKISSFLRSIPDYPFQPGSSLSAAGINYGLIERVKATKQLAGLDVDVDVDVDVEHSPSL